MLYPPVATESFLTPKATGKIHSMTYKANLNANSILEYDKAKRLWRSFGLHTTTVIYSAPFFPIYCLIY